MIKHFLQSINAREIARNRPIFMERTTNFDFTMTRQTWNKIFSELQRFFFFFDYQNNPALVPIIPSDPVQARGNVRECAGMCGTCRINVLVLVRDQRWIFIPFNLK
jgi:hypothetical protein